MTSSTLMTAAQMGEQLALQATDWIGQRTDYLLQRVFEDGGQTRRMRCGSKDVALLIQAMVKGLGYRSHAAPLAEDKPFGHWEVSAALPAQVCPNLDLSADRWLASNMSRQEREQDEENGMLEQRRKLDAEWERRCAALKEST